MECTDQAGQQLRAVLEGARICCVGEMTLRDRLALLSIGTAIGLAMVSWVFGI